MFVPHLNFEPYDKNQSIADIFHDLDATSKNGKQNGFDFVLNAEQFNYAHFHGEGAGFKYSLHHHSDKPIIQFSSDLITPGTETQINVKPVITYTTEKAISRTIFLFKI